MKKNILGLLLIIGMSANLVADDRFVRDDIKEVVVDSATNLMWQDNADTKTGTKTWKEAIDYCEDLTFSGYDDWHLPNYNELWSIVDKERGKPSIYQTFKNIINSEYWTSTTDLHVDTAEWYIDFWGNINNTHPKSSVFYVRCVRDNY